MELAPFGIHVIVVEPGAIKTEWGGIARDSLLRYSGETAYRDQAQMHARMFEGADKSNMASPPEVVARTIAKALRAKRPRTRYATGGGAGFILALRRFTSDRGFDWLMRTIERRMAATSS
jgi:NAD(P)-dependent dehydrogenase (short-subunit alcohol dehydrogenase family)